MPIPKLPKSTRVNGVKWRVMPRRQVTHEGEECEGLCRFDSKVIEVSIGSENELHILENFFHELLHAAIGESGVQSISDDAEHAIIGTLEKWLAANCDLRPKARKRPNGRK